MLKIIVNKETGEYIDEVTDTPGFGVTFQIRKLSTGEIITEEKEVSDEELAELKGEQE